MCCDIAVCLVLIFFFKSPYPLVSFKMEIAMVYEKVCGSCGFYDLEKVESEKVGAIGRCRFSPPKPSADDKGAVWPIVNATDWCGEFIPLE